MSRVAVFNSVTLIFAWCVLAMAPQLGCNSDGHASDDQESDTGSGEPLDTGGGFDTALPDPPATELPKTCDEARNAQTAAGCEFIAVDLMSTVLYEVAKPTDIDPAYAVAVSNIHPDTPVEVTASHRVDGKWQIWTTVTVQPRDSQIIVFDDYEAFEAPDYVTGIVDGGVYKLESTDIPFIAYQFNPLDGEDSATSDASMLIPTAFWGKEYSIPGYKTMVGLGVTFPAYAAVIALKDATEVTVEPSFSPEPKPPNVPGVAEPFTVTLNEGETLYVESGYSYGNIKNEAIAGTVIKSDADHPIAVFSGHDCANIPTGVSYCDHVEEQLPSASALGYNFVAARHPVRGLTHNRTDKVLWQIVAGHRNTTLSFSAPVGVKAYDSKGDEFHWTTTRLARPGDYLEIWVDGTAENPGDFTINATSKAMVVQYMSSAEYVDAGFLDGDPVMTYVPPAEQFLSKYVVFIPETWEKDFLVLTKPVGREVLIDGTLADQSKFHEIAGSGYEVARIKTDDGVHVIESVDATDPVGVMVVGYDHHDSYAYPGGMGIRPIPVK